MEAERGRSQPNTPLKREKRRLKRIRGLSQLVEEIDSEEEHTMASLYAQKVQPQLDNRLDESKGCWRVS